MKITEKCSLSSTASSSPGATPLRTPEDLKSNILKAQAEAAAVMVRDAAVFQSQEYADFVLSWLSKQFYSTNMRSSVHESQWGWFLLLVLLCRLPQRNTSLLLEIKTVMCRMHLSGMTKSSPADKSMANITVFFVALECIYIGFVISGA